MNEPKKNNTILDEMQEQAIRAMREALKRASYSVDVVLNIFMLNGVPEEERERIVEAALNDTGFGYGKPKEADHVPEATEEAEA